MWFLHDHSKVGSLIYFYLSPVLLLITYTFFIVCFIITTALQFHMHPFCIILFHLPAHKFAEYLLKFPLLYPCCLKNLCFLSISYNNISLSISICRYSVVHLIFCFPQLNFSILFSFFVASHFLSIFLAGAYG